MNPKRIWTADEIALLHIGGLSNREIARRLLVSEALIRKKLIELRPPESSVTSEREQWWPLPAGHPVSWQAISDQPWPGP